MVRLARPTYNERDRMSLSPQHVSRTHGVSISQHHHGGYRWRELNCDTLFPSFKHGRSHALRRVESTGADQSHEIADFASKVEYGDYYAVRNHGCIDKRDKGVENKTSDEEQVRVVVEELDEDVKMVQLEMEDDFLSSCVPYASLILPDFIAKLSGDDSFLELNFGFDGGNCSWNVRREEDELSNVHRGTDKLPHGAGGSLDGGNNGSGFRCIAVCGYYEGEANDDSDEDDTDDEDSDHSDDDNDEDDNNGHGHGEDSSADYSNGNDGDNGDASDDDNDDTDDDSGDGDNGGDHGGGDEDGDDEDEDGEGEDGEDGDHDEGDENEDGDDGDGEYEHGDGEDGEGEDGGGEYGEDGVGEDEDGEGLHGEDADGEDEDGEGEDGEDGDGEDEDGAESDGNARVMSSYDDDADEASDEYDGCDDNGFGDNDHDAGNGDDVDSQDGDDVDVANDGNVQGEDDYDSEVDGSEDVDSDGSDDPGGSDPSEDDEEDLHQGADGNEADDFVGDDALRTCCAHIIATMRNDPTITRAAVSRIIKQFEGLLALYSRRHSQILSNFCNRHNLLEHPDVNNTLRLLEFHTPFKGITSSRGQISAIKNHFRYVSPTTVHLGNRIDQVNVGRGQFRQRPVAENFQYVSIIDTLKLVIGKRNVASYIENRRPLPDGVMESYTDGSQYANHPFLQRFPDALQLMLYFDDAEVANALGSKCSIHNLGIFYLIVLNIPPYINSLLNGIHVVALANYQDLKERGFRPVLQPFLDELRELESDNGIEVVVNGVRKTLRATLVAVTGDSKACHELFGFLACGARCFCRHCMITRQELHAGNITFGEPRTRELHDHHLQIVPNNEEAQTQTGVREDTSLHDSRFWHISRNRLSDPMHDGPHGVNGVVINLTLRELIIVRGLLRCCDLNRRIKAFNYGRYDRLNKPTANFSRLILQEARTNHSLKQTAAQSMCLLRVLPFLLDDLGIEEDDEHLQLISMLQRITDIMFAPRIHRTMLAYFEHMLEEFRTLFRRLYPDVSEINKQHHFMHYPRFTEEMGPMRVYSCFREEGKIRPLKRHVTSCNSFKNVPKTAIESAQISQALFWGTNSEDLEIPRQVAGQRMESAQNLRTAQLLVACGFGQDDVFATAECAEYHGTAYNIADMVVTRSAPHNENDLHAFGRICGIIVRDDTLWLEVEQWRTHGFDERLGAYIVAPIEGGPVHLLDVSRLPLHPPLSIWRDYTTELQYLSLKHFVL